MLVNLHTFNSRIFQVPIACSVVLDQWSIDVVFCGQFAYKQVPEDDAKLRSILMQYTTDPIYTNIYIDLVRHFFTARQRCILAIVKPSVSQSVCPSVRHSPVSCQNNSSYDHAVFTGG